MDRQKQYALLEAVLFAIGDSVDLQKLSEVIEEDPKVTKEIIEEMILRYEEEDRGITIVCLDKRYQMCSKPALHEALIQVVKTPRKQVLTETVIETLSIIAYKQPVTRLEIEKIRGVSCDHAVNKLLEYDLIKELGRLNAPGKPLLFGTTEQFLRTFHVSSISDLPKPNEDQIEAFKLQAEEEMKSIGIIP